jgi:hypothetical protein
MILIGLIAAWGLLWFYNPLLADFVGILLGLYLIDCTLRPRRDCHWCKGAKRTARRPGDPAFRLCWLCHGQGAFVRPGALIWRRNRYLYRGDPREEDPKMGKMGGM